MKTFVITFKALLFTIFFLPFSASAMDDLQMKELQDQLEAEQYFSVRWSRNFL